MAKKKQDFQGALMEGAKAAAGGVAGELLADFVSKQLPDTMSEEWRERMPEIIPIAGGLAGLMFIPDERWKPAFYGMIGAGASGFADDLMGAMQGFQRVRHINGHEADKLDKGIEFLDGLQVTAFETESHDGMSD